jgi:hypothetical protein
MINLPTILWITDPALGSLLDGNTQAVQAHTSLDKAFSVLIWQSAVNLAADLSIVG